MNKSLEETETHLSMVASNRKIWELFTEDIVVQRKMARLGIKPIRETSNGVGKFYSIPSNQISIRRARTTTMSEENKKKASERMKKMQEARNK